MRKRGKLYLTWHITRVESTVFDLSVSPQAVLSTGAVPSSLSDAKTARCRAFGPIIPSRPCHHRYQVSMMAQCA